ncbi:hypothetical protein EDB89DRAFT_2067538 [Lactarius sanguifluus]|nr:hypothetical protein EDB89DRAFT_2067538 [Lactarius sanguifluus]
MPALVSSKKVIPQLLQNVKQSKSANGSVRGSSSVCASGPVERAIASNAEITTTPDELSSSPQLPDLPPSFFANGFGVSLSDTLAPPTPSRAHSLTLLAVDNSPENPSTHPPSSIPAGQFFTFFLFITTTALVMKAWFHCVAAAFGDPAPAQTVAGLMLPMLVLYTGYTIPGPSMVEVDLVHQHMQMCLSRTTFAGLSAQSPAKVLWRENCFIAISYDYSYSDIWQNFGIIIGFGIAFVAAFDFFIEYNTSVSGETSTTLFK